MLRTLVALQTRGVLARDRARASLRRNAAAKIRIKDDAPTDLTIGARDRGSVTLEQVIIALGLFLLAVAVIAGITAAVNSRLSQIN